MFLLQKEKRKKDRIIPIEETDIPSRAQSIPNRLSLFLVTWRPIPSLSFLLCLRSGLDNRRVFFFSLAPQRSLSLFLARGGKPFENDAQHLYMRPCLCTDRRIVGRLTRRTYHWINANNNLKVCLCVSLSVVFIYLWHVYTDNLLFVCEDSHVWRAAPSRRWQAEGKQIPQGAK